MQVSAEEIERVWQEADCLYSEQQLERVIDRMAMEIDSKLAKSDPLLLCVMTGGIVFAGKLLPKLAFPLQVDYLHATRYRGATTGADDIHWLAKPQTSVAGRSVVVIDDILDEGHTLVDIVRQLEQAGAERVYTAVLVDKQHDRKARRELKADFTGIEVVDRYLFGYGMDYKGYLRNAAGIYAVKGL